MQRFALDPELFHIKQADYKDREEFKRDMPYLVNEMTGLRITHID